MSRFDKLKRLKDEVHRLFHEELDVNAVIDQLHTNEQFADASHKQVQAFYSYFQEKSNVEEENERRVAECKQQIVEFQQRITEHKKQVTNKNRQIIKRQVSKYERKLTRKQQMKTQLETMIKYQQNSNKFLIYDAHSVDRVVLKDFWRGRFFMNVEDSDSSDVHTIKFNDLFQDAIKSFTVQIVGDIYGIYPLKFPFVLLHEFDSSNDLTYFCLVNLDFENESLQFIRSFEFNAYCQVLVNKPDAAKFLLKKGDDINECKLVTNQIQIGKKLALDPNFNIDRGSYFDEQICSLKFILSPNNQYENFQLAQVKMLLYDVERNENSTRDLNSTPDIVNCFNPYNLNNFAWTHDTVFFKVQFSLTEKYGVIFTNPQLRNWKVIEFATDLHINCIQSFVDGALMICAEEDQDKRKIYKLQMRKPDFLRNMAWIAMVKLFKEAKIKSPYEEAREYLPLNSEIQPFIFTED